jgi:hypothetical protein
MMVRLARWEKTGAIAGVCAAVSLAIGYLVVRSTTAPLAGSDAEYARVLLAERAKWEWVTLLRLIGGTLVLWFAALLGDRLRLLEGEPARLAETAFGLGVVWAGVWLLSAFFNSASIMLAADYADPAGARIAGVLAAEIPSVLTAGVVFTLLLATCVVTVRSTGFPKAYAYATGALAGLMLVLALVDWYGPGTLGWMIVTLALAWTAATSVLLLRPMVRLKADTTDV